LVNETNGSVLPSVIMILNKMVSRNAILDMTLMPNQINEIALVIESIQENSPRAASAIFHVFDMMVENGGIADLSQVAPQLEVLAEAIGRLEASAPDHHVRRGQETPKAAAAQASVHTPADSKPPAKAKVVTKATPKVAAPEAEAPAPVLVASKAPMPPKAKIVTKEETATPAEVAPMVQEMASAPAEEPEKTLAFGGMKAEAIGHDAELMGVNLPKRPPAVNPRKSIIGDYIICLEDGKKMKMLKRHLRTHFGLTEDQYRERWGLPDNYPMVAPNYAKQKSHYAKSTGLGTSKMRQEVAEKREKIEA
jgi:predicted transcriptional regulator